MLPTNFNERLNEMMDVKLEEITEKTQETFSRDSADMAQRGMLHSSNTLGLYQKKRLAQINRRAEAVLECQTRLISTMKIQVSDTLVSELKNQVEAWVSDEWCERSIQTDPDLGLVKDYKPEFREEALRTRNSAIKKTSLEVDLLVDGLRAQTTTHAPTLVKELDQKFKILLSPDQIKNDFNEWAKQLAPINGQIAVLFVDLDKFKELNTKYTEPKIDHDFLPDAMRLTESFVRVRGQAAKHGGDEYVLILPNHDATEAVARAAIELNELSLSSREVGEKLGWEPRRLNPAMSWLENRGHAKFSSAMGSSPYRFTTMFVTPSTRRLASEV